MDNPDNDFLLPIIMACDGTHMGQSNASSWPLLFTTTILNQQTRNLPIAWRPLGYVNDLTLLQTPSISSKQSGDEKAARLHAIFKTILGSLIDAQQPGALDNIPLKLGGFLKTDNLKVPLQFIIGGMQGGDKMCFNCAMIILQPIFDSLDNYQGSAVACKHK